jgi:hypothetical protein
MAGCGKEYNGDRKVEGTPLRCGVNLYWKVPGKERERTQEVNLCDECRKEQQ